MKPFMDQLAVAVRQRGNAVVVGIDPRYDQLPDELRLDHPSLDQKAEAYARFGCEIIDVVADKVPAIKPQMAFFEQLGPAGLAALHRVVAHARRRNLLVILDGKRNDIGSTATAYAQAYLGRDSAWQGDALTVSPYLGDDSLTPFVETAVAHQAGIFVLVKTSNPGGKTFQDLTVNGRTLYTHVAQHVEELASASAGEFGYGAVGAVVGATYPQQLAELRELMPHTWFLVPGFGAQGGTAEDVQPAFDADGLGAIVNSSRAIIFAYRRPEFAVAAAQSWQAAVEAATDEMTGQLGVTA